MSVSMMPGSRALTVIPSVPDLVGGRLDEPVDGVLAGDVAGDPGLAQLALDRRRDDDPPGLPRDHVLQRPAHPPEHVVEVPVDLELPLLVGHLGDRCRLQHAAGVEHHDVELAVVVDGEVDEPLDRLLLGGVAGVERGPVAGAHLVQAHLALGLVAAVDDHRRALADERVGDAPADAARAAGDRGDLAVELAHRPCPFQYGAVPPSIEISEPVMPAPASDASSTATAATSSTSQSRLVADSLAYQLRNSW